jgi:hypothetical protein
MAIENLNNRNNDVVVFLNELEAVLGDAPAQGAAISSLTDSTGGTVDAVLSATTSTPITDSTTGTADGTLADVTATFSQVILNNNFADVANKINANVADLSTVNDNVAELHVKVDAILAALRLHGLIGA